MPRKCSTLYHGKFVEVTMMNDGTRNMPHVKVKMFSFPEDPIEHGSWIKSLPNVLSCSATKNIGICNKHYPINCPRVIKKTHSYLVPTLFLHQYLVLPKQVYLYKQLIHLVLLLQPNQDT